MTQPIVCIWCGTPGGYANQLKVALDPYGEPLLAECEWCISSEYFRKLGAKGNGN